MELKNFVIFQEFTENELDEIKSILKNERYLAGQVIVKKDQKSDRLYLLSSGSLRVDVPMELIETTNEEIATLLPGDTFCEISFIDREITSARVSCNENAAVYSITFHELDKLISNNDSIAKKIYRGILLTVVKRLRKTTSDLVISRFFVTSYFTD